MKGSADKDSCIIRSTERNIVGVQICASKGMKEWRCGSKPSMRFTVLLGALKCHTFDDTRLNVLLVPNKEKEIFLCNVIQFPI